MIPSQMLKGTLEGCILAIIGQKETYGCVISRGLENYGIGKIAEGTIYPLLLRLEKNGCVTAVYRQSEMGPKRKYYSLTEEGRRERDLFRRSYVELNAAVNRLMSDTGGIADEQQDEAFDERE